MDTLRALRVFVRTLELGSLSAAAREAGTTQPTVSKLLAQLESDLAVRLFERSTRGLSPTEQGQQFYRDSRLVLEQYDAAVTWASGQGDEAQGYTRGNLRSMVEKGMLDMEEMRIIWKSRPIPNGPLVVRTDLPAAFKADFKQFHLALPGSHPAIYEQIEKGGGRSVAPRGHRRHAPGSCSRP